MTPLFTAPTALPGGLRRTFGPQLEAERTRLLYQGSLVPTLLMLGVGLLVSALLWQPGTHLLVSGWLLWLMVLITLRVILVAAFDAALPTDQAAARWRRRFLLGAGASGLTLGLAALALVPVQNFYQQAWVFGLLGAAALSASIAYAVSASAFLCFVLPCLGPPIAFLLVSGGAYQQGWGWLGLMLLLSLCLVAWQVHRLVERGVLRRLHNQALIAELQQAQLDSASLTRALEEQVHQRTQAQALLRSAHDELAQRVEARGAALAEANQALSHSQARLALALEASELGLWDWNLRTDEVHHTGLERLFGESTGALPRVLQHLRPRLHPEDLPALKRALVNHMKGRSEAYRVEYRIRHHDGHWVWIEDRGRAVEHAPDGRVLRMTGTRRDITLRKQQEEQQQLAASVFSAVSEGIVILQPGFRILAINQAFTRITGYAADECVGECLFDLPLSRDAARHRTAIEQSLQERGGWQGEVVEARSDGALYPQRLQFSVIESEHGVPLKVVAFVSDLSSRRASEQRVHYLTYHDELTGLGNRGLLRQRLLEASRSLRPGQQSLALLHIDLDRFKLLNESLGHEAADRILQHAARRISEAVPHAHTVARLSGDAFVVLLDGYNHLASILAVAARVLGKVRAPVTEDGRTLALSASLGLSLYPDNTQDLNELLNQADLAVREAKRLGGNQLQLFTQTLQADAWPRLELEQQLRRAVEGRELEVHYQPRVLLETGAMVAVEALVRWRHPERGLVLPGEFIGVAEATGLIGALGDFVLRSACVEVQRLRRSALPGLRVSVNLAAQQLHQGNLVSTVQQILASSGLPADALELELTESQWLQNLDHARATFEQLRALGVRLAIDDFGTGYSSLSYLKRLPVDCVKIDRVFVQELGGDEPAGGTIVKAVVDLAHGLGLEVVAEGVEAPVQAEILRQWGCEQAQGFLYSAALPAHALATRGIGNSHAV